MITNNVVERLFPLGHYFAILSKAYVGALFNGMESSELDRYYMVIQVLDEGKEQYTQQTLGNFLNVDKVTMVRIIDHLTNKEMIERVNNPIDRREKFIKLTAKGKGIVDNINTVVKELNETTMKGFTKEEQDKLYDMLERMNENLNDLPSHKIYMNFKRSRK